MQRVPMTQDGYNRLSSELKMLIKVERPQVIEALSVARDHGDLSENAEYDAAREKQGFVEGRIAELQDKIARSQVINPATITSDKIVFGARVKLYDVDEDRDCDYYIVGDDESDISKGFISISSPIARALIGREADDSVEVVVPAGIKNFEILDVNYGPIPSNN